MADDRCRDCCLPGTFPNVRAAQAEQDELRARYSEVLASVGETPQKSNVAIAEVLAHNSAVVIARPVADTLQLVANRRAAYGSFYQQLAAATMKPEDSPWDVRRRTVDEAFFPGYRERICFGVLTPGHLAPESYGSCSIELNPLYIIHRTSLFIGNTVLWCMTNDITFANFTNLPRGLRADWDNRAILAAIKFVGFEPAGDVEELQRAFVQGNGSSTEDDDFIEAHIWGGFTRVAIARITVSSRAVPESLYQHAVALLAETCATAGIPLHLTWIRR